MAAGIEQTPSIQMERATKEALKEQLHPSLARGIPVPTAQAVTRDCHGDSVTNEQHRQAQHRAAPAAAGKASTAAQGTPAATPASARDLPSSLEVVVKHGEGGCPV